MVCASSPTYHWSCAHKSLNTCIHQTIKVDVVVMAWIDAVAPDALAKRLRVTIAQHFGGGRGNLSKGLIEVIEAWDQKDETAKIAKTPFRTSRDAQTPSNVKERAVAALANTRADGLRLLQRLEAIGPSRNP